MTSTTRTGRSKPFMATSPTAAHLHDALHESVRTRWEQDLLMRRLGTEPGSQIHHRADRGVVDTIAKADPSQRRVSGGDTDPEAELEARPTPRLDQVCHVGSDGNGHPDRALGMIRLLDRIIEERHDPVAREALEGPLEFGHPCTKDFVIPAKHPEDILRRG
jgi:hypothetical protein